MGVSSRSQPKASQPEEYSYSSKVVPSKTTHAWMARKASTSGVRKQISPIRRYPVPAERYPGWGEGGI